MNWFTFAWYSIKNAVRSVGNLFSKKEQDYPDGEIVMHLVVHRALNGHVVRLTVHEERDIVETMHVVSDDENLYSEIEKIVREHVNVEA